MSSLNIPEFNASVLRLVDRLNADTQRKWEVTFETNNMDVRMCITSGYYRLFSRSLDMRRDVPFQEAFINEFVQQCVKYVSTISEETIKEVRESIHA